MPYPYVNYAQKLSKKDEEIAEMNRRLGRKVIITIVGYTALKLAIYMSIRKLAKAAAEKK